MRRKKVMETTSIATVVSFGRSSRCEPRIVIALTVGSTVTLTSLGSVTRGGKSFTPSPRLRKMLETNGEKATEVTQENGNEL